MNRTAWECIRCHRVNAPHLDYCGCSPAPNTLPTITIPASPWPVVVPTVTGPNTYPYPTPNTGTIICGDDIRLTGFTS